MIEENAANSLTHNEVMSFLTDVAMNTTKQDRVLVEGGTLHRGDGGLEVQESHDMDEVRLATARSNLNAICERHRIKLSCILKPFNGGAGHYSAVPAGDEWTDMRWEAN